MTLTVNKNNRIRLVSGGSGRAQKIMKTNNILKTVGLGLAISAFAACQAGAISSFQAYNTPSTTLGNQGAGGGFTYTGPYTVGMEFTANSVVTVNELGAFDSGGAAWAAPVDVAIYNVATKTIVGESAVFSSATPGTLASGSAYRFLSVAPFQLIAGDTYMIVAAGLGTHANPEYNAAGGATAITMNNDGGALTFLNANYYTAGTTLAFPTSPDTGPIGRYGAGSFGFALTAVPEAQTFAIAGVSMLGLVFIGRKVVTKSAAKAVTPVV